MSVPTAISQPKERANREHKLRPKPARQSPTLLMSGEGKRSDWPCLKPPRPSSTLLKDGGPAAALSVLPWFVLFGLILGVLAWALTRGVYWFEDLFDAMPGNNYTRHISGMLLVGLILYGFILLYAG